jgi:DNA-binding NtrC family response regulator
MKTILIAEDDITSMLYYKIVFKITNYNIIYIENTENIFDIIQKNNIDLVILDIKMTPIDGVEVAKILKRDFPHIKIIAQTAYIHFFVKANERLLFDIFLEKPLSPSIIKKSIEKLLN